MVDIHMALNLPNNTPIQKITCWSKILISSVRTRDAPSDPIFSEEAVQKSLLDNPAIENLKITCGARWIRNPSLIQGAHSSVTLSFEDHDGSLLKSILRTRLFTFGACHDLMSDHAYIPSHEPQSPVIGAYGRGD